MIKTLIILLFLCLTIIVGAVYFIIWPLALQYLNAVSTVLQPALESVSGALPAVPVEGIEGIGGLIALLPVLQTLGIETLGQINELAAGGVTAEEVQQALVILRDKLSVEELTHLRSLLFQQ
ncbi:MAG: hypothetical protein KGZ75_03080 [Syntrophomonadaceae bacterium]|jgi:hypothetical protein|nr:hypothetical protein [Syntrophomonadaceae bacterium]